uniref:COesterase domain-containing protein n=1 Tax=Parastrongyloides trichosuri TaxID=131310 RepID=A0A0N4ZGY0_PARTI
MFYLFLLTIFTSSFYCTVITTEESNIEYTEVYNTTSGSVRGTKLNINGTQVDQLLGIPFAISPLNYSRFGTPKPMTKWPDLHNATSPARACMQAHSERGFENKYYNMSKNDQSEDCLQLNMWVPNPNTTEKGVLVFIFGGGFRFGSPSLDIYNGSILAAKTGLIVVNINYRLGMLGFAYMSMGDNVTGNMGLLDQQMALRWVHENIANFTGDPNNVTLWGQGSGAICASAHLFSKNSEKYFQKLILMSGSINNLLAAKEPTYVDSATRIAAQKMRCFNESSSAKHKEIFNCLVNRTAEDIMKYSERSTYQVDMPSILGENIILNDTYFFNGSLYFKLFTGQIKSYVDVLFGMPNKDGSFYLPILKDSEKYGCNYTKIFNYDNNTCNFNYSTYYNFYNLTRVTLQINDTVFSDVVEK